MTNATTDYAVKVEVFKAWRDAGRSKASLAAEHDVSPRTISRWIESVEEKGLPVDPVVEVTKTASPTTSADTRYLEVAYKSVENGDAVSDLAEEYGVSESTIRRWLKKASAELVSESESEASTTEYRYTASARSIAITQITNGRTTGQVAADKSSDSFEEMLDKLLDSNFSQEALAEVFILLQPAKVVEKFSHGKLQIDAAKREILYVADEDTVPYRVSNKLTARVIEMVREGDTGVSTLLNFLEKLMENPSRRAVDELYGFLEANDIVIQPDGDFIAWKRVRSDYLDIHSGTMDNSPGKVLKVARNMVDEDSNRTCSYGLHVCSKAYLPHFGSSGGGNRIVSVKVNPADVVAIPADYNNAKMRCAGYTVLEDVSNQHISYLM